MEGISNPGPTESGLMLKTGQEAISNPGSTFTYLCATNKKSSRLNFVDFTWKKPCILTQNLKELYNTYNKRGSKN